MTVINPVDDTVVTRNVQVAGPDDVDAAVAAARAAFEGPWKRFSGAQRANCMLKFADLIEANVEKLAMYAWKSYCCWLTTCLRVLQITTALPTRSAEKCFQRTEMGCTN